MEEIEGKKYTEALDMIHKATQEACLRQGTDTFSLEEFTKFAPIISLVRLLIR
jgi:hypothetical protein